VIRILFKPNVLSPRQVIIALNIFKR